MEPLKVYNYLTIARQRLFDAIRPLSEQQYAQTFPIGLGTLGRTLTHIMVSEWYYMQRMQQNDVPPYETWPIKDDSPPPFAALEAKWNEQAGETLAALREVADWSEQIEYTVTDDDGRLTIVTASPSDLFTQLILHEVHHRAQAMNMLRQLGIAAEDLDYNALMYKRREAGSKGEMTDG